MKIIEAREKATATIHEVLVDDEDFESLSKVKWRVRVDVTGYLNVDAFHESKYLRLGRTILGLPKGDTRQCDHVNLNTLDNQKSNLRIVTARQNLANRRPIIGQKNPFKGIRRQASKSSWEARIGSSRVPNAERHIGFFPTAEDAARAYDAEAVARYGVHALTNEALGLFR